MNWLKMTSLWLKSLLRSPRKSTLAVWEEKLDEFGHEMRSLSAELEREAHKRALAARPDLSDDPGTDVPAPHLGQVQRVDLTTPVKPGEQASSRLQNLAPSDWDLLSPEDKALLEQITPRDPTKVIAYPAPAEQSTADWVTEQLKHAGYSEAYGLRFAALRRVAVGMSMRHLSELKARADRKDESLSVHDLIALRSRGIA